MLILSDDKSAYATLRGLVAVLEKEAQENRAKLQCYSTASRDYAACRAAIGEINSTIALIQSTDVWQQGEQEAKRVKNVAHIHMNYPSEAFRNPLTFTTQIELEKLLGQLPARDTADAVMSYGVSFVRCTDNNCIFYQHYASEHGY
jgi:hypothetical protein